MSLPVNGLESTLENTREIKKHIVGMGADVVGIADMALYDREILGVADKVAQDYPLAISFGLLVPKGSPPLPAGELPSRYARLPPC
jgi:hypothetical protein